MIGLNRVALFLGSLLSATILVSEAAAQATNETLFRDVRVFDGKGEALSGPTSVLVRENLIASVGDSLDAAPDATVIDGGGRTLMPGLIDAHWHAMLGHVDKWRSQRRMDVMSMKPRKLSAVLS